MVWSEIGSGDDFVALAPAEKLEMQHSAKDIMAVFRASHFEERHEAQTRIRMRKRISLERNLL